MFIKTEFKKYLNSKGLKPVSVLKYSEQVPAFLEKISGKSLYNYHNIADLVPAISKIKKNITFINTDKKGNNMYSAGINHYISFIQQNPSLLFDIAVSSSLNDTHEIRLARLQKKERQTSKINF